MASVTLSIEFPEDPFAFAATLVPAMDVEIERALDQSVAAILNRLRTTYLAEQDPSGTPWIPSEAGKKRRAKGGTGTLFDTGQLFRSIQLVPGATRGSRTITSDVSYGSFHQEGRGQEKREFLSFTPEHEQLAVSIFERKILDLLVSLQ